MRKRVRFALIAVVVLGLLAAAMYAVYRASQQVPEFYAEAISIPAESQEKESDLMLQQVTTLYNELQGKRPWQPGLQGRDDQRLAGRRPAAKPPHAAAHGDARSPRTHRSAGHHDGLPGRSRRIPRRRFASGQRLRRVGMTWWGCGSTRPGWERFPGRSGPCWTRLPTPPENRTSTSVGVRPIATLWH